MNGLYKITTTDQAEKVGEVYVSGKEGRVSDRQMLMVTWLPAVIGSVSI